jgi:hypothetical protein
LRWCSTWPGSTARRWCGAALRGRSQLDVGSNYTDLPDGQGAVRVIAMARNGLGLGLTRALLADYPLVVLWCSGSRCRATKT